MAKRSKMFKTISEFMDGKKTYVGIGVMVLGMFGVAKYVGIETDVANVINSGFQFFGAVLALYGNAKSHRN